MKYLYIFKITFIKHVLAITSQNEFSRNNWLICSAIWEVVDIGVGLPPPAPNLDPTAPCLPLPLSEQRALHARAKFS